MSVKIPLPVIIKRIEKNDALNQQEENNINKIIDSGQKENEDFAQLKEDLKQNQALSPEKSQALLKIDKIIAEKKEILGKIREIFAERKDYLECNGELLVEINETIKEKQLEIADFLLFISNCFEQISKKELEIFDLIISKVKLDNITSDFYSSLSDLFESLGIINENLAKMFLIINKPNMALVNENEALEQKKLSNTYIFETFKHYPLKKNCLFEKYNHEQEYSINGHCFLKYFKLYKKYKREINYFCHKDLNFEEIAYVVKFLKDIGKSDKEISEIIGSSKKL
ncbi:MAG: hypothetical protein LBE80_11335 [Deltaproteobacteria bacterium]|jgi:hypothetical protein|nr:hypothetical protein [Deltaproteobacteria bacterium]